MVYQGPFGTRQEGDPGLTPYAEPLFFKIPPHTIQEGVNTQIDQKDQKTPPLCYLYVQKVPQEAMEDQSQTLRWVNQ